MSRQALYSCGTCSTINDEPAGICLACSYSCHEGHQLYELYTKRNFRCDCGNSKFVNNPCKLAPKKDTINDQNAYNDNFKGVYCTCKRPYPDPDNDDDDEMIQCIICEDWFHGLHLGVEIPEEGFSEMICISCMEKLPFLWHYQAEKTEVKIEKTDETEQVEVKDESTGKVVQNNETDSGIESSCDSVMSTSSFTVKNCKLSGFDIKVKVAEKVVATFWEDSWREKLCKCNHCMTLYSSVGCQFLVDQKDTVHYYEQQGKECGIKVSRYDKGISALNQMDRLKQIEAIEGYNSLKGELIDYLKKFAENKKVVREEDIKEFFDQMNSRKRQRIEIPYHCR